MNVFWYLFNWWLTWTYTDVAVIGRWRAGDAWIYTFSILLLASTILILASYGIFSGISQAWKGFFTPKIKNPDFKKKPAVKYFLAWYAWWQKRPKISAKWGKKIAETLGKHRYLTLFLLNLIPYVPYLSAATIAAAKLKKIPYAIWIILAGNTTKVFYMVALVYTSPTWLSWCRYMIGKIF